MGLAKEHLVTDLRVVATIAGKPEAADTVRGVLSALAVASRDDAGCIAYELCESVDTPGTFVVIETWRTKDELEAHLTTDHVRDAFAKTGDLILSPPSIVVLNPLEL